MRRGEGACAPVKRGVVLGALAAILLLTAAVCLLHAVNAVSLRGTVQADDCEAMERGVGRLADFRGETVALSRSDGEQFLTYVREARTEGGVLYLTGALMRLHQEVGEVRVRVGLIAEAIGGEEDPAGEVLLLNTQMVRDWALSAQYGCDDHCGFAAAVRRSALRTAEEGWQYRIVLIDEADGALRLFETGCWVSLLEDGVGMAHVTVPGEEAQRDE